MKVYRFVYLFMFCLLAFSGIRAQQFTDELVRNDFVLPTSFVFDPVGGMFVCQRAGVLFYVDVNGNKQQEAVLDISEEVASWGDHGLTGCALDPNFDQNGYIYLYYVTDHHYLLNFGTPDYNPAITDLHMPTIGRVTRYTIENTGGLRQAIPASRKVILGKTITDGPVFIHESHSSGSLQFGTDGSLLLSCGDGNTYNGANVGGDVLGGYASQAIAEGFMTPDQDIGSYRSQYLNSYNGKILRFDPDTGEGYPTNPWFQPSDPTSAASRTWVLGLRNPFRFSVRPGSGGDDPGEGSPGAIFIGDVGSNKWEELNISSAGGENFGWPITEGHFGNESFESLPTPENHLAPNTLAGQNGCEGAYLNFRQVFKRPLPDTDVPFYHPCDASVLMESSIPVFIETPAAIAWNHSRTNTFAQTLIPGFNATGQFVPENVLTATDQIETDTFNGFCSIGGIYYENGPYPEKYHGAYMQADLSGWIRAFYADEVQRITGTDSFCQTCKNVIFLTIHPLEKQIWYCNIEGEIRRIAYTSTPPPVPVLHADKIYGISPLQISFDASESFSPIGSPLSYSWEFDDGQTAAGIQPVHTFIQDGEVQASFQVKLTVTDTAGVSATRTQTVFVNNSPPAVNILGIEDNARYPAGSGFLLNLRAEVTDAENHPDELDYTWWVIIHHNTHIHPQIVSNKRIDDVVLSPVGCQEDTFWYRILLEVQDAGGMKGADELLLLPWCGDNFVELLDLSADTAASGVLLTWKTGFEQALIGFEIQRSSGNHDFTKLGFVPAIETGVNGNDYDFLDILPLSGKAEYRIRAMREGGAFFFSNPVEMQYQRQTYLYFYPNPFEDEISFVLNKCVDDKAALELFTMTGQFLLRREWDATPETALNAHLSVAELPAGVYFYSFRNGYLHYTGKIVKY